MYRSSKTFRNFPCAHRKWRHQGHCAHVHGYSRQFIVWFEADERDENGLVVDFGSLKEVRAWLEERFAVLARRRDELRTTDPAAALRWGMGLVMRPFHGKLDPRVIRERVATALEIEEVVA